ncbi:MAG: hypothetical protein ABFC34_12800 [Methanobacterium sp.]
MRISTQNNEEPKIVAIQVPYNESTNTDFGHKDMSNKGLIAKLKMASVGINLQNWLKYFENTKPSKLRLLMLICGTGIVTENFQ